PLPAIRPTGSDRLRDGLPRFDAALFLDRRLAATDPRFLLEEANRILYESAPRPGAPGGARAEVPQRLHGAHALLGLDEVTIVAVPDAVQRNWHRGGGTRVEAPSPP